MPENIIQQSQGVSQKRGDKPLERESFMAQPFLKWAGGKRQLLPVIQQYIPLSYNCYYEPFVGAGAVLFFLQPGKAIINDTNCELINCYRVIRSSPDELIELCQQHRNKNSKEYYYQLRGQDRSDSYTCLSDVERAARIIYLNKTCFNGLFRVNRQGQFNVPYGNYANPSIVDPLLIKAVSKYLNYADIEILTGDFREAVVNAKKGDFIYFDPPYHPISETSSFTGYSLEGFREEEQIQLKHTCDELADRGCRVLLSNSSADFIKSLYDDSRYEIVEVQASRAINSVATKRGQINELLIYNQYACKK